MSNDGSRIFDIGKLAEPATKLIEKISDAVEGSCRPWQIRRVARAEADAAEIAAVSQVKITELQRRAANRFIAEETKKQINMETITAKALPELKPDAKPQEMENDWIANFFDKCRLISDDQMQALWARLLAGEANSPGHYSKRTVNALASMDKTDAVLFRNLCSFVWSTRGTRRALIYDSEHSIYNEQGIHVASLLHLESIGLISFDDMRGFKRPGLPKEITASYYGEAVRIGFSEDAGNELDLGHVILSKTGGQLASLSDSQPHPAFKLYVLQHWQSLGYTVTPLDRAEETKDVPLPDKG